MRSNKEYNLYGTLNYIVGLAVGSSLVYFNAPLYILALSGIIAGILIGFVMGIYKTIQNK